MASTSTIGTMKAIVYGPGGSVKMVQRDMPKTCSRDEVLVRVCCAGLNPVDAKDVMGDKLPHTMKSFTRWLIQNKIPGFDFSGQVMECPSGTYRVGDYVFGTVPPFTGVLCEYVVAPLDQVCLKPLSLSMEEAAALPLVGLTALQSMSPYLFGEEEESVLVIGGSGGTGHVAIQVAKALGAETVATICSGRNQGFVKRMGADHVVDYTKGRVIRDLEDLVDKMGRPFDLVLDCVTSADTRDAQHGYAQNIASNPGIVEGMYLRIGGPSIDWLRAGMERTFPVLFSEGKAFDCWKGRHKLFWIRFQNSSDELQRLKNWADQGKVKPTISRVLDFNPGEVNSAFESLLGRRVQGKLVVKISGSY